MAQFFSIFGSVIGQDDNHCKEERFPKGVIVIPSKQKWYKEKSFQFFDCFTCLDSMFFFWAWRITLRTLSPAAITLEDTFDLPNVDSTNSLWHEPLGKPNIQGIDKKGGIREWLMPRWKTSKTIQYFYTSSVLRLPSTEPTLYVWLSNDLFVSRLN